MPIPTQELALTIVTMWRVSIPTTETDKKTINYQDIYNERLLHLPFL